MGSRRVALQVTRYAICHRLSSSCCADASLQGLQREDLIVKFGGLSHRSFTAGSLQPLVSLVGANENVS